MIAPGVGKNGDALERKDANGRLLMAHALPASAPWQSLCLDFHKISHYQACCKACLWSLDENRQSDLSKFDIETCSRAP